MIKNLFSIGILLTVPFSANASDRFVLDFRITQGESKVVSGKALVSQKMNTWSRGVKRSYLKLRCQQQKSGSTEKLYSTVDLFDGLQITHQLVGSKLELTVVRSSVQPRLLEIRALSKHECGDLSPIVTNTTESYSFSAKDGVNETRSFGELMTFRANIQTISQLR